MAKFSAGRVASLSSVTTPMCGKGDGNNFGKASAMIRSLLSSIPGDWMSAEIDPSSGRSIMSFFQSYLDSGLCSRELEAIPPMCSDLKCKIKDKRLGKFLSGS